jgi:enediyne biosynthesis protein E5
VVEHIVEKLIGRLDPRVFQIVFLGSFLTIGVLVRDFSVAWQQVALTFASALATQAFWLARLKLWHAGFLSALVTSFGLSILVRADNFWVHPLIAVLAISSKFTLRIDDRHVFNPANLGAMLAAYVLPGAWISPGQWGQDILLAAWFIALGTIVTQRSRRLDIGWCFLGFYIGLISLRVLWLGQPLAIIAHQLQNGGLLLFAFFMISDPLTTPRNIRARVAFTALVALGAFAWQYQVIKPNGLVVALFALTPLVIGLNRRWPGPKFQWRPVASAPTAAAATSAGLAPARQSVGAAGEMAVKPR